MRTPTNETRRLDIDGGKAGDQIGSPALRTCILTRIEARQDLLVRLAVSPDGDVLPDVRARAPGRGAWIGVSRSELEIAIAKGKLKAALSRAFKTTDLMIPGDLGQLIADQLERAALDRLGLESRSGFLLTGSEKIAAEARSGALELLLHAADASPDGAAKLAQAWRVGRDEEGSGRKGLTLPVGRPILSMALGRENVVHIGLIDARAAARISYAITRWLRYIGPDPDALPCETGSQGASALPA